MKKEKVKEKKHNEPVVSIFFQPFVLIFLDQLFNCSIRTEPNAKGAKGNKIQKQILTRK